MFFVVRIKTIVIAALLLLSLAFGSLLLFTDILPGTVTASGTTVISKEDLQVLIEKIFETRNTAMVENDMRTIEFLYNKNTRNGTWAYEHQAKKVKYLHNWADKQGVRFTSIDTLVLIRWARDKGAGVTVNFTASTEYRYIYENQPDTENMLRIGTYHVLDLTKVEDGWLISKEWYTDPFADSLNLENLKTEENKAFILSQEARDFSTLSQRRKNAVAYADRYCGAAADEEYGFSYNKKYKNYNSLGGDCANFASQILYEGGKFKKTHTWNYDRDGSRAWVNAQGFKDFMLGSGRASLIASGSYNKVLKASYKLLPGDFIAYEKKGKITHISVVTGADSRGYSLVNCHNTDRYRVPWDLGWSDSGIKFYLVRVHY